MTFMSLVSAGGILVLLLIVFLFVALVVAINYKRMKSDRFYINPDLAPGRVGRQPRTAARVWKPEPRFTTEHVEATAASRRKSGLFETEAANDEADESQR